jgi:periplasmic protein TonB
LVDERYRSGELSQPAHDAWPADLRLLPDASRVVFNRPAPTLNRSHLRSRQGVLLLVLALHVGLVALFYLPKARERLTMVLPPMEVSIISDAPPHREAPQPMPLNLQQPPQVKLIVPEVPINVPVAEVPAAMLAVTAVAAAPTVTSKGEPGPVEPVSPPRFDAAYLKNPAPVYPTMSRRLHEEGTVLMRVRVSQQGVAAEVLIERTSGSRRLDDAAMAAVRHWRFDPAHRGHDTVEAWVLVPVEFDMRR